MFEIGHISKNTYSLTAAVEQLHSICSLPKVTYLAYAQSESLIQTLGSGNCDAVFQVNTWIAPASSMNLIL